MFNKENLYEFHNLLLKYLTKFFFLRTTYLTIYKKNEWKLAQEIPKLRSRVFLYFARLLAIMLPDKCYAALGFKQLLQKFYVHQHELVGRDSVSICTM